MISLANIPLKNIKAHPVRSGALAFLSLVQAACVFVTLFLLNSMRADLSLAERRFGADIIVYPYAALTKISSKKLLMQGTPVISYLPRAALKRLSECEHIAQISHQVYLLDETGSEPMWIVGIDTESDFAIRPWIKEGERFLPKDGEVLAGSRVAVALRGGEVRLFGADFPVTAHLAQTGSPLDGMVFVSMETLSSLVALSKKIGISDYDSVNPQKQFSAVLIKTEDKNYVDGVSHWINLHVRKVVAVRSEEALVAAASGIRGNLIVIVAVALVAWAVILLALFLAQSMMMKERKKELFVWQTAGASQKIISRVMTKESLLVHTAGALAGTILALLVALVKQAGTGTALSAGSLFAGACASVAVSLFVSALATKIAVLAATKQRDGQMLVEM